METSKLKEKVEHYTGQPIDQFEFWQVISDLDRYDFSIECSRFGVSHFIVDDPQHIEREQRNRPDVDYYPFTKAEEKRSSFKHRSIKTEDSTIFAVTPLIQTSLPPIRKKTR